METNYSGDAEENTKHHVQLLSLEPEHRVVVLSHGKVLTSQTVDRERGGEREGERERVLCSNCIYMNSELFQ